MPLQTRFRSCTCGSRDVARAAVLPVIAGGRGGLSGRCARGRGRRALAAGGGGGRGGGGCSRRAATGGRCHMLSNGRRRYGCRHPDACASAVFDARCACSWGMQQHLQGCTGPVGARGAAAGCILWEGTIRALVGRHFSILASVCVQAAATMRGTNSCQARGSWKDLAKRAGSSARAWPIECSQQPPSCR